jgi:hypothetical protein
MKKIITLLIVLASGYTSIAQLCVPNSSSLNFNGTSAYINVTDQNLNITDSITVEAWINSTQWGATSAQNTIFCKHGWSQGEAGYVLRAGGNGQLSFNIGGVDTNGVNVSWVNDTTPNSAVITLNVWHHVAGTYDGDSLKVYIDGILKQTKAFNGTIAPSPGYAPRIGALSDPTYGPDRYFKGNIDEVRVWHRALSQAEIAANMYNHIDTATAVGLAGYWRFNEGTGTTVNDITGNGNTGTLLNTIWATNVPFNPIPPTPIITWAGTNLYVNTTLAIQWYFNGTLISGATTTTYTPTQNGTYTVIVTNVSGCTKLSPPFNLTSAGISENQDWNAAIIFPNPANGTENITFTIPYADNNLLLTINDISGRVVKTTAILKAKTDRLTLSDNKFIKGVYFYKLTSDHSSYFGKFVIK